MGKFWHRHSRSPPRGGGRRRSSRSPPPRSRGRSASPGAGRESQARELPAEWLESRKLAKGRSRTPSPESRSPERRGPSRSRHGKRERGRGRRRNKSRGRGRSRSSSRSSIDLDTVPHLKKAVMKRQKYGTALRPDTSVLGGLLQDIKKYNRTADFEQTENAQKLFKQVDPKKASRQKVMLMSEFLSTKAIELEEAERRKRDAERDSRSPSPVGCAPGESYDEFKERKKQEKIERVRKVEEKKYKAQQQIAKLLLGKSWGKNNSPEGSHATANVGNTHAWLMQSFGSNAAQNPAMAAAAAELQRWVQMQQMQQMTAPNPAPTPKISGVQASHIPQTDPSLSANQWALGTSRTAAPLPPLRPPMPKENPPNFSNADHPPNFSNGDHASQPQPPPPGIGGKIQPEGLRRGGGGTAEVKNPTSALPLPPLPPEAYRRAAAAAMAAEKNMIENAMSSEPVRKVEMFDAILNDKGDEDEDEDGDDEENGEKDV